MPHTNRRRIVALIFAVAVGTGGAVRAAVDVVRPPDAIRVVTDTTDGPPTDAARVTAAVAGDGLHVQLSAPTAAVKTVELHWAGTLDPSTRCLGDTWERAYADLQWRPLDEKHPMPWSFLATAGGVTDGYGVRTGPASLCCWSADASGVTLTADVRCGGVGVQLGDRTLDVCTVVQHRGTKGEAPFDVAAAFCRQMCPRPRVNKQPVYGFNDWYCTYGHNTAAGFLKDAAALAALAPAGDNRPFMVVDDGWQASRQGSHSAGNPWDRTNAKFGSTMPELARGVKAMGGRPGLWYRPLEAWPDAAKDQLLHKGAFDPSVPAVLARITADVRRFHGWGFELVKHDFSTWEITGRWGNKMGDNVVHGGWHFADRSRTTAEVITGLYQAIRDGGGDDMTIEGCNTVSHLAAGVFELQRIGDDTSGTEWKRTVDYGVNSLAFRAAQQGAFYGADADCVGLAKAGAVPWEKNRQWLDLVARSGTPLFVSWRTDLLDEDVKGAIRAAFAAAAVPQPVGRPHDWDEGRTPSRWVLGGREVTYQW